MEDHPALQKQTFGNGEIYEDGCVGCNSEDFSNQRTNQKWSGRTKRRSEINGEQQFKWNQQHRRSRKGQPWSLMRVIGAASNAALLRIYFLFSYRKRAKNLLRQISRSSRHVAPAAFRSSCAIRT